jgi:hypothetical protein
MGMIGDEEINISRRRRFNTYPLISLIPYPLLTSLRFSALSAFSAFSAVKLPHAELVEA